ncbi:helix-turn-helix transcriptional regulator [Sutcliffiella horikoshii]|uniref:Helix-turn-helix transcriptional regulator n=1 Tax=Sutcliffiella horikoshii TaxID=79883 RepID=A0A5D4SN58_9BACI|nr:helix-turn-helix transcriptional regulator [Sutcliffiella horikoshii]TYS64469.1 helix-turn-helix transcriptional regulator [Sutcliffiella horikoshii]
MIKTNLQTILDDKDISIRQVSRDIDYRLETVRLLYHNQLERIPKDLLDKLCSYLSVSPGDLLIYEDNENDNN